MQVDVLPLPSVTIHVTVVVPNGNGKGALLVTDNIEQLSCVIGWINVGFVEVQVPASTLKLCAPAHVIVGLMLSKMVIACIQVFVLPVPSVTVQVTIVIPNGKTNGALLVTVTEPQLPEVVGGVSKGKVFEQVSGSTLKLCGPAQVIVRLVLLVTVMIWVQVLVLPLPSVTVHITVVVPNGYTRGALLVIEDTLQLSSAIGVPKATPVAVHPLLVVVLTFGGQIIVGFILSRIVITCVQVFVLPLPSVAVQVTVVLPSGNNPGALLVNDTTLQLSLVVGAVSIGNASEHVPGSTLKICGPEQAIVGLILSNTVIACIHVFVLPLPSVTVHVTIVTPNGKTAGALFVMDVTEQLSLVVGVINAGLVDTQFPASTLKLCGPLQVIVGIMLSNTVIT